MKKFLIIVFIFIAFLFSYKAEAKTLKFAQISDTHVSLSGEDYRGRNVTKSASYLKKAIEQINKNKDIQFVVFTGDMIDTANRDDMVAFLKLAGKLNKPYYLVLGNHEVFRYQNFNKQVYKHALWLHHPKMLFKDTSYVFKANSEIVFIVVDGANELMPGPSGYFKPQTLEWLDKQLQKYSDKKVVIMQHFPLIPPVKKVSHNTVDVEKYFQVINSYDNIIAIISGHFHYNNVIYKRGIYHMSAPAFVIPPHDYKIITIEYDPKYLFSNPAEFSVSQELMPMGELEPDKKDTETENDTNSEASNGSNL